MVHMSLLKAIARCQWGARPNPVLVTEERKAFITLPLSVSNGKSMGARGAVGGCHLLSLLAFCPGSSVGQVLCLPGVELFIFGGLGITGYHRLCSAIEAFTTVLYGWNISLPAFASAS